MRRAHMRLVLAVLFAALVPVAACSADPTGVGEPDADAAAPLDAAKEDASANATDASSKPDAVGDAAVGCGEFTGDTRFTCSKDGNSRGKCVSGSLVQEACARGCLRETAPADDVCMGTTTTFSCTGTFGTQKAQNGDYYLTSFGCWVDSSNAVHTDPGDNCIPGCFSKATSTGLCSSSQSGATCEEKVDWYVADSARFGCLGRMRVENPKNGKKVIVVALDAGPACWVENDVSHAILDASGRVNEYLFGTQNGYSDKALVHVVEVDPSTPLGPI
jgi:hypothetical protein